MKRDVFNKKGDFITSPEISQMFGEVGSAQQMLGLWAINFFNKSKLWDDEDKTRNKRVSLLEFGPGRGTLMKDLLRVLLEFDLLRNLEVNFVEASPFLTKEQQKRVKQLMKAKDIWLVFSELQQNQLKLDQRDFELQNTAKFTKCERLASEDGSLVFNWFQTYEAYLAHNQDALRKNRGTNSSAALPVLIICHEFFDALPVMVFEKLDRGWVEKLVDVSIEVDAKYLPLTQQKLPAGQFRLQQLECDPRAEPVPHLRAQPAQRFDQDRRPHRNLAQMFAWLTQHWSS
jgi:NADH dehydrogenase [ubiquinone] 1 alpha subcomplex assembly factor 7